MASIQQTAPAVMNRITQAGQTPSSNAGNVDEMFVSLTKDAGALYEGVVAQGGVVTALQDAVTTVTARCQRIETAAVPASTVANLAGTVEELRGLCDKNDQDLKAHIRQFEQEVKTDQALIQEALQKADKAFGEMNEMRMKQERTQQEQMNMIAQEIQRQSGVQVQQTLQALQQEAAVARQELEGLKKWLGDVSLQDWTKTMVNDRDEFKRQVMREIGDIKMNGGQGQGQGIGWSQGKRGILESKVWGGVRSIAHPDNKIPYKEWHAKLKNAYYQARPGTRNQDMWAWMEVKAKEILRSVRTGGEIPKGDLSPTAEEMQEYGVTMIDLEGFNEDLAAVLIEKTEGSLHNKVNTICEKANEDRKKDGGLRAYFEVNTLFMSTTGLKLSQRMKRLFEPRQARTEEEVADLIEEWEREEAEIYRQDATLGLTDPWRMTALTCILTQRLREHVELNSGSLTTYDALRKEVMAVAVQRRMAKNTVSKRDPNSMDTAHVGHQGKGPGNEEWNGAAVPYVQQQTWFNVGYQGDAAGVQGDWGGDWQGEDWQGGQQDGGMEGEANAVGKGKAGAKGGKGGGFRGSCYKCGMYGHSSRFCPNKGKGKGGKKGDAGFRPQWGGKGNQQWQSGGQGFRKGDGRKGGIKGNCWECGEQGHASIHCPRKKTANSVEGPGASSGSGGSTTGAAQDSKGGAGGGEMASVDFEGFSITHVQKSIDAVENDEDERKGPPSLVSSEDSEPERMQEVNEDSDEEEEEDPPKDWWWEALRKASEGEDQESLKAIAKMNHEKSKRARKRMRQKENRKKRGVKLCNLGCACPGKDCRIECPPGLQARMEETKESEEPARGPDERSAIGPGASSTETKEVMGMEEDEEVFPITIDSGAVDTVGPKRVGEGFPITPTKESVMGIGYKAANGTYIKNYGERVIEGLTEKGQNVKMKVTVADVSKVLASVSKICECGSRVVFDDAGSYIEDKRTGERTALHKRRGVYVMDIKVRRSKEKAVEGVSEEQEGVFSGQGADLI